MRIIEKIAHIVSAFQKPASGAVLEATPNDRTEDVSFGISPDRITQILQQANQGNPSDQCRLGREIREKNADIAHALGTRCNTILACPWAVKTKSTDAHVQDVCTRIAHTLQQAKVDALIKHASNAIMDGFAGAEIVYAPGGDIVGFISIPPESFSFENSFSPQIRLDSGRLIDLPREKLFFIRHTFESDATRGGIIRPLAWLYCFSNINLKDLLTFIERYGMPFVVAKVDDTVEAKEKNKLHRLISAFGPSGGGIVSRAVELEMLQSANTGGDVYFRLLEYLEKAITKVVLGQTATAGDGGGWSNASAQSKVRQDILEADCRIISEAITQCVIRPLLALQYPEISENVYFEIDCSEPADKKAEIEVEKARAEVLDILIRSRIITPSRALEAYIRKQYNVIPMDAETLAAWDKTDGVRVDAPVSAPAENPFGLAMSEATEKSPEMPASEKKAADAIMEWFAPLQAQEEALDAILDDDFAKELNAMASQPRFGNSDAFEAIAMQDVFEEIEKGGQNGRT